MNVKAMIKACFRIFFMFGGSIMLPSSAKSLTLYGLTNCKDNSYTEPVAVYGALEAKKCKFKKLEVFGNSELADCVASEVSVNGNITIINSRVLADTNVFGYLESKNTSFGKISATTNSITLDGSSAETVYVSKSADDREQVLYLQNNANVKVSITFESGKGKIIADRTVHLPQDIKGATVVHQ